MRRDDLIWIHAVRRNPSSLAESNADAITQRREMFFLRAVARMSPESLQEKCEKVGSCLDKEEKSPYCISPRLTEICRRGIVL